MEMEISWSLGYSPSLPAGARPRSGSTFGMVGMNGSAAYADIDTGVAITLMPTDSPRTSRRSPA
jgi:CubicO group peptidase (beta-lactamase class C family)